MAVVDSLEIEISAQASGAAKSLDSLIERLERLEKQLGLSTKGGDFNSVNSGFEKVSKSSGDFLSKLAKIGLTTKAIKISFRSLSNAIKKSMDFVETLNYSERAWGQVAENADLTPWKLLGYSSADAYAESFTERAKELTAKMTGFTVDADGILTSTGMPGLGIDPAKVMQYQAMFGQMASSIGITSENSLLLSSALMRIGADLASVKNMDFDKVWTDMASGLAGMSRTLDKYGVNIRNVNLQQKLNELGISANIAALNQNDKALLRTIILLDSTKYSWGDLANTLNQPANQLRLLQSNFSNLAKTIGNLFLPVVSKVLPFVNGLVMALQKLFAWIGKLFGIKIADFSSSIGSMENTSFEGLTDGIEDASNKLGNASKNAKKFKDHLLGIDELNVISQDDQSTGGGAGSVGGAGGMGGLLDEAFLNAISEYDAAWNKAFENIQSKAQNVADTIAQISLFIADNIKTGFDISFVSNSWEDLKENILSINATLTKIFSDNDVSRSISEMTIGLFQGLGSVVGTITSLGISLGSGITGGISSALSDTSSFIEEKIISISDNIKSVFGDITDFSEAISKIGAAFESEGFQKIVEFFAKIGIFVQSKILDTVTGLFSDFVSIVTKPFSDNAEEWKTFFENIFNLTSNLITPLENILDLLIQSDGSYEDSWIHKLLQSFSSFNSEKIGSILDSMNTGLEKLMNRTNGISFESVVKMFSEAWGKISGWFDENVIGPISKSWEGFSTRVSQIFEGLWIIIQAVWSVVSGWFKDKIINPISEKFSGFKETVFNVFLGLWNNIKNVWSVVSGWFNQTIISPVRSAFSTLCDKVGGFFASLWSGIKSGVISAMNAVISGIESGINFIVNGINNLIGGFNKIVSWAAKVAEVDWGGVSKIQTVRLTRIYAYENGGFPEPASLFWAGENGVPELMGTVGGRTAVASGAEITGIRQEIRNTANEEMILLREQNSLLRELISKDFGTYIGDKEIARANSRGQKQLGYQLIMDV